MNIPEKILAIQKESDSDFIANFCNEGHYLDDNGREVTHMTCQTDAKQFIRFIHQREALIIKELTK